MAPVQFPTAAAFRDWLEANHATKAELMLALNRKESGLGGLTYAEALDEALCYGWIDGVRKGLDAQRYTIRFTPRKPRSIWSRINLAHVARLTKDGRMQPPGLKALAARTEARTGVYSFENRPKSFSPELVRRFRADRPAWDFFHAQPPGYQKIMVWWVMSAKQEETQRRRLAHLVGESAAARRLDMAAPFRPGKPVTSTRRRAP